MRVLMGATAGKKLIVAGFIFSFVFSLFAGGKKADYQRAAALSAKSRNTVFRKSVDAKRRRSDYFIRHLLER